MSLSFSSLHREGCFIEHSNQDDHFVCGRCDAKFHIKDRVTMKDEDKCFQLCRTCFIIIWEKSEIKK